MLRIRDKKIIWLLVFLHLAIALPLAFSLNIWVDEASTLHTTQHGFVQTFRSLFTDEKQAPLYFLLMSCWRKLDDSIIFARLFSILGSLLAIGAFSRLARRIWDEKTAIFITAVFALHPYLFWASLEIRLYSLVILITCLLFSFFYDGFLSENSAAGKSRIYFVGTAIAALYTNYYLGSLLVGGFAALLMLRAKAAMDAQQMDVALKLLDAVVKLRPDYVEGWNRRATLFYLKNDYAHSLEDIEQVLVREPRHFGALAGLGMIMQDIGDEKRALDAFRKALALNPHLEKVPELVKTLTEKVEGRDI